MSSLYPETFLHFLWKFQIIDETLLRTFPDSKQVQVIFPGWYNTSEGPDFLEAKIEVDSTSYFGSIEIHLNERDWFSHQHDKNEQYGNVILHVFVDESSPKILEKNPRKLLSLKLDDSFIKEELNKLPSFDYKLKNEGIGKCGTFYFGKAEKKIQKLIYDISIERLNSRSELLKKEQKDFQFNEDSFLMKKVFRYLGKGAFEDEFEKINEILPFENLQFFLNKPYLESRKNILSKWLGILGYLDTIPEEINAECRREWKNWIQEWNLFLSKSNDLDEFKINKKRRFRPQNHPVFRLIGIFNFIYFSKQKGPLKAWLIFLNKLDSTRSNLDISIKFFNLEIQKLFPTYEWDSFLYFLKPRNKSTFKKKVSLFIGKEKILTLFVNVIIPYFYQYAKKENLDWLKKLLFDLYLILPAEGRNNKTSFMEKRFFLSDNKSKLKNSLYYSQGLIEIHDSCCHNYYQGCRNCNLIKLIESDL